MKTPNESHPMFNESESTNSLTYQSSKSEVCEDGFCNQKLAAAAKPFLLWWQICIILVWILIFTIAILAFGYFMFHRHKKQQKLQQTLPESSEEDQPPVTTVCSENVPIVPDTSPEENLNFEKPESPTLVAPKKKKKKKKGVTKAEAEGSTASPESQNPTPSKPLTNFSYPKIPIIYSRALKILRTKTLTSDDSTLMKINYPQIKRDVMNCEVDLLCSKSAAEMFSYLKILAEVAEEKLAEVGCKFDENHCITEMSNAGRELILNKKTAATTAYFAFGAEYHRFIPEDFVYKRPAGIPLLMTIALQPRFPDLYRIKACSVIREQLIEVHGYFSPDRRESMPYPINVLEDAYIRNPNIYRNQPNNS